MSFSTTNRLFPFSNAIDEKFTGRKTKPSMNRTLRGIWIEGSDNCEHPESSIRVNREFVLNMIDENDSQYEKHDKQRISTLRGIKIVRRDEYENAYDSIRVNREFDSNEIDESN
jgi:hypothetical protein